MLESAPNALFARAARLEEKVSVSTNYTANLELDFAKLLFFRFGAFLRQRRPPFSPVQGRNHLMRLLLEVKDERS